MASEDDFKPGMFHLLGSLSEQGIDAMFERAQGYLKEFGGYPMKSINNVAGVLQSMLGRREEAIDLFKQVLLDDPENINALENSRIVYDQLGRQEDAEVCAARVKLLLDASESRRTLALRKARCLAEQGLATTFDIPVFESANDIGGDDFDRNKKAIVFFEKAFEVDDKNYRVFQPEERLQWQFFLAQSYHHVFGHNFRLGSATDDRQKIFDKAVQGLVRVARESNQNKYRAKAWSLIGTFFWKEPWTEDGGEPSSVSDCDLAVEYRNPDKCFKKAVDLCPEDPKILSRYARFLMMKRSNQEAMNILNKSVGLDASCNNWFAFSSRGQVCKFMYVQQQQAFRKKQRRNPPDNTLLTRARQDFEHSLAIHPSLQDRTRLGEILDMLGQKDKALEAFQYVVDHLDGQKNSEVHNKMGNCLLHVKDRSRQAIEAFKRAIEIERPNLTRLSDAYNALQLLLKMYGDRQDFKHLLDEICYWLAMVIEKYEDAPTSELVERLCKQFRELMARVRRRLADQQRFTVASRIEQHIRRPSSPAQAKAGQHGKVTANIRPPLSESKNQMKKHFDCLIHHAEGGDADWVYYSLLPRLEESHGYKCCVLARDSQSRDFESCVPYTGSIVVILTRSFCGDEHCMDQLRRIVEDSSNIVFPIMLEECNVPDVLDGKRTIPYYSWEVLLRGIEDACGLR